MKLRNIDLNKIISIIEDKISFIIGISVFRYKKDYHYVPNIYGKSSVKQVDIRNDQVFYEIATRAISQKTTFLYYDRLYTLYQAVKNITNIYSNINIVEVGVYKGGSSLFIAETAKRLSKGNIKMFSIDTFEGHSELDITSGIDGTHKPGLFKEADYQTVKKYLSEFDFITVVKNRIQDCEVTLAEYRFHLIHLDVDIYEPMIYSLMLFSSIIEKHGIMVIDDFANKNCPGVKKAVDEFVFNNPKDVIKIELMTGQCLLIKT